MCGICGAWGSLSRESLDRMVRALRHRGPDDSGVFLDERVALGATRLAILDLGPGGHQPMGAQNGEVWIAYNGETYNFRSERSILEANGHVFVSHSDTEVILRMYLHYGDCFVERVRGMFALAIYDKRGGPGRERLLLARDHFGIKPLLVARCGSRILFASELKALLQSDLLSADIDPEALRQLLTYGAVRQPRTILRDVAALPAASRMIIDRDGTRVAQYWQLRADRRPDLAGLGYDELAAETQRLIAESVSLQMVSDVPLGAFLSGGIDSSLLVALMGRYAAGRVRTFSIGFEGEGRAIDETSIATDTARLIGTDHTNVVVSSADVCREIPSIIAALDQPSVDGVNSYLVAKVAREQVTVAISGLGGDELFAGYPWWFESLLLEDQHNAAHPQKTRAKAFVASIVGQSVFDRLSLGSLGGGIRHCREFQSLPARFAARNQIFSGTEVAQILHPALRSLASSGRSLHRDFGASDELPAAEPVARISALCARSYMVDQLLRDNDAVTMWHSLEVRVPFLDPALADLALALPRHAKLRAVAAGGAPAVNGKRVLVDILDALCPGRARLGTKRGFNLPYDAWLRGPLRGVVDDALAADGVARAGLLDPSAVERLRQRYLAGQATWGQLWVLTTLQLWRSQRPSNGRQEE
jgi:asparagine synthase (glutamine-hydrolysing)